MNSRPPWGFCGEGISSGVSGVVFRTPLCEVSEKQRAFQGWKRMDLARWLGRWLGPYQKRSQMAGNGYECDVSRKPPLKNGGIKKRNLRRVPAHRPRCRAVRSRTSETKDDVFKRVRVLPSVYLPSAWDLKGLPVYTTTGTNTRRKGRGAVPRLTGRAARRGLRGRGNAARCCETLRKKQKLQLAQKAKIRVFSFLHPFRPFQRSRAPRLGLSASR